MEKNVFIKLLLPLMMCFGASFSMSATATATRYRQYVKLFCSFYSAVNIGAPISWRNIDRGAVLDILMSQVTDHDFQRHVDTRANYTYFSQLTVGVVETDGQKHFFISDPRPTGGTDSTHAEEKLIKFLVDNGLIQSIPHLNLTNSPCDKCARELIEAFKDRDIKPDINILWVYGKGLKAENDAKYMRAILSISELLHAGFKVGVWEWKDYGEYLKDLFTNTTDLDLKNIARLQIRHAARFDKRTKITKDSLDTIKKFHLDWEEMLRRLMNKDDGTEDHDGGGDDGDENPHNNDDPVDDEEDEGGSFFNLIWNVVIYLGNALNEFTGWQKIIVMPRVHYIAITGVSALLGWLVAHIVRLMSSKKRAHSQR